MDCYLKSVNRVLGKTISDSELAFLTNYSTTKCWEDTHITTSFPVPLVYNSRLINVEEVQKLFSNLCYTYFDNFEEYYTFLLENFLENDITVRMDMYYLNICPKAHFGAHFVVLDKVTEEKIIFWDAINGKGELDREIFKQAVEDEHGRLSYGYLVIWSHKNGKKGLKISSSLINEVLENRILFLKQTLFELESMKIATVIDDRLGNLYLRYSHMGMILSDLWHSNSRLENFIFISKHISVLQSLFFLTFIHQYRQLAKGYTKKVITKTATIDDWHKFLEKYIDIVKYETVAYEKLYAHEAR